MIYFNQTNISATHGRAFKECLVGSIAGIKPFFSKSVNQIQISTFPVILIFTSVFDFVILLTLRKTSRLHSPSKMLIFNLSVTDLAVGVFVWPVCAKAITSTKCICVDVVIVVGFLLTAESLLTLTAISLERVLAIHLQHKFKIVVTKKRIARTIIILWILGTLTVFFWLLPRTIRISCIVVLLTTCLITVVTSYAQVFRMLNRHAKQLQSRNGYQAALTILHRKSAVTSAWVVGSVLVLYLPYVCCIITGEIIGLSNEVRIAMNITGILCFLNSAVSPAIYLFRMRDLRNAVRTVFWSKIHLKPQSIGRSIRVYHISPSSVGMSHISFRQASTVGEVEVAENKTSRNVQRSLAVDSSTINKGYEN